MPNHGLRKRDDYFFLQQCCPFGFKLTQCTVHHDSIKEAEEFAYSTSQIFSKKNLNFNRQSSSNAVAQP